MTRSSLLAVLCLAVPACAAAPEDPFAGGGAGGKSDGYGAVDVASTALSIDVAAQRGTATLTLSADGPVALDAQGLVVRSVTAAAEPLDFEIIDGVLVIDTEASALTIEYDFSVQTNADGLLSGGSTVVWPYFCGNLFPCHAAPEDGQQFSLELSGLPSEQIAIYPKEISADAPAYMLAWAVGAYTTAVLGTTTAGTQVSVSWLPRGKTKALAGTRHLTEVFDWYERTLGDYLYGSEVASVSVVWGEGMYGGMEHHPFWHVAADAMDDEETHAHEAAHGWFGDGVRLRCWEDFVLSEGTVSYLAARALGQTAGAELERAIWAGYRSELRAAVASEQTVAWPEGCGSIDILEDGLFSSIPYMKGAYFYRAVAAEIGADALDQVIARFYQAHRGKAAGMSDMIAAIHADTGFDPEPLVARWLRTKGLPRTIPD